MFGIGIVVLLFIALAISIGANLYFTWKIKKLQNLKVVGTIYVYVDEDGSGNPGLYLQLENEDMFKALEDCKVVCVNTKVIKCNSPE